MVINSLGNYIGRIAKKYGNKEEIDSKKEFENIKNFVELLKKKIIKPISSETLLLFTKLENKIRGNVNIHTKILKSDLVDILTQLKVSEISIKTNNEGKVMDILLKKK